MDAVFRYGLGKNIYRIRSAYAGAMTTNYSFSEREKYCDTQEKIDFIDKYTNEYLRVRPYFSEDYYPLTEFSDKLDTWCAVQFNRPKKCDGIIQVWRREESPYESAKFFLRGIDENSNYIISDADGGDMKISGKSLVNDGFNVALPDRRVAKIYFYKIEK